MSIISSAPILSTPFRPPRSLRMTREEIGSYLGLKLETVSRAFSRFQDDGLISVQQKHIRIIDIPRLKALLAPPDGRIG